MPLHLTHVQFHSYGTEGKRHFSSAAARIADAVNRNPNVSIDVGQIVFGPTMTETQVVELYQRLGGYTAQPVFGGRASG